MTTVEVRDLDEHGEDRACGIIAYDGKSYTLNPAKSPILQSVLDTTVRHRGGKTLTKADGEEFLKALPAKFASAYLRVGVVDGIATG